MPRTLFGVKSASGSWWCERVCAPSSLGTLLCWQVESQACHCHHGLALAGLWWEQEPHSSAVRRPQLGTWSVPQHSSAQCHLPLLSLLVTLPVPWSCSHTHSPALVTPARVCPCLALLTVTPVPAVLPRPHLSPHPQCHLPPPCHPPEQPPAPGRLRGGSGAAPSEAQPCLPHLAGQRRRCSRPRRHKAFPVGARPLAGPVGSRVSGGAGHGSAVPSTPQPARLYTLFFFIFFSGGFAVPRVSPPCPWQRCLCGVTCCATGRYQAVIVVTVALVTPSAWRCWAMSPLPLGAR